MKPALFFTVMIFLSGGSSAWAQSAVKDTVREDMMRETQVIQENPQNTALMQLPKLEIEFKAGTDRGLAETRFLVPLISNLQNLFYAQIKAAGDDKDNYNTALGFGYRHFSTDQMLGAYGFIDRQATSFGGRFNRLVLGAERKSGAWETRLNGYLPLSNSKQKLYNFSNVDVSHPLADIGLKLRETGGGQFSRTEESLTGFDFEIGRTLPFISDKPEALKIYAGAYGFYGDETYDTNGVRTRLAYDVSPAVQIAGTAQYDDERKAQAFLNLIFRFGGHGLASPVWGVD